MAVLRKRKTKNPNGSGTIGQRRDGLYELKVFVDTPDGKRKRISVYGKTWEEADAERTRIKERQRKGVPIETTAMTVGQYMKYWLEEVAEPRIRRKTYSTYEGEVRLHIVPGLGKRKLKNLETSHVRTWLNGMRTLCQCCAQGKDAARAERDRTKARCCAKARPECCKDYLSVSSVRHVLRVLRAALTDAVDEELLSRNVAKLVKLRVTDDYKVRSLTRTDALKLLKAAEQHRLYALWAVALTMGLRRGEALGLSWSDVNLGTGRLTIRRALQRVDGELMLLPVKTEGSNATLPIPRQLVAILKAHMTRQSEDAAKAGRDWQKTGLVFTTALGGKIEPRNMNRMFYQLCEKADVPRVRVHDLRHSCATLLFAQGVEAATVQAILRHSSITVTTGIYMEVIERVKRDALDSMNTLLPEFDDDADPT